MYIILSIIVIILLVLLVWSCCAINPTDERKIKEEIEALKKILEERNGRHNDV